MEVDNVELTHGSEDDGASEHNGVPNQKRVREEDESHEENDGVSKKQKVEVEKSVEEAKESSGPVKLGYKIFESSVEMFDYFYNFLHAWPPYLNVNKYEHVMLLELLKNGHTEPDEKICGRIRAFQVRKHPLFKSKCFFIIKEDESVDDFSFRKCVDHILPLPEEMQIKPDVNKALGGGKRHGAKGGTGRGGGRGHGRGRR